MKDFGAEVEALYWLTPASDLYGLGMPPRTRAGAFPGRRPSWLAWLAYFGVLQWSVVRFRVPIVLVLTACTLAAGVVAVGPPELPR